jgi:hypothetical protein
VVVNTRFGGTYKSMVFKKYYKKHFIHKNNSGKKGNPKTLA